MPVVPRAHSYYIGKTFYIEGFHGTNDIKGIMKKGIRLGRDVRNPWDEGYNENIEEFEGPVLFLTTSFSEAKRYAGLDPTGGVIKVRVPASWIERTEDGYEHGYGYLWARHYLFTRPILPNNIVEVFPNR